MNKKGVVFTIISLVISTILLVGFFSFLDLPVDSQTDSVLQKVGNTNTFLDQVENYIGDLIEVQGIIVLNELIDHARDNGQGSLSDAESVLLQCFNGTSSTISCSNITSELDELQEYSKNKLNIDFEYDITDLEFTQNSDTGAWNVMVNLYLDFDIDDDYASWNIENKNITRIVSIRNLRDPAYVNKSDQSAVTSYPEMNITGPRTVNFASGQNQFENITRNNQYIHYPGGVNFISRLQGTVELSDCCGLVSVVRPAITGEHGDCTTTSLASFYMRDEAYSGSDDMYLVNFSKLTSSQRSSLGVDEDNPGLQNATLPEGLLEYVGLNNSAHLDSC